MITELLGVQQGTSSEHFTYVTPLTYLITQVYYVYYSIGSLNVSPL